MAAMVSLIVNLLGVHFQLWRLKPLFHTSISTLPFDLGLFPLFTCLLIYAIRRYNQHALLLCVICAAIKLSMEWAYYQFGMIQYGHGWNFGWTFISYLAASLLVYLYDRSLEPNPARTR